MATLTLGGEGGAGGEGGEGKEGGAAAAPGVDWTGNAAHGQARAPWLPSYHPYQAWLPSYHPCQAGSVEKTALAALAAEAEATAAAAAAAPGVDWTGNAAHGQARPPT